MKKEALRVSTTIPAAPTTLYLAWLSSDQHGAMSGASARIDPSVGGTFTALNGYVSGKLVALDLGRRIVMSWRTTDFPREAPDSRVEVYFEALGASTRLTVLHTDIPEGQGDQHRLVWNDRYFAPMRAFFSKYLPDPRQPPPRRMAPAEQEAEEEEPPKKGEGGAEAPASSKRLRQLASSPGGPPAHAAARGLDADMSDAARGARDGKEPLSEPRLAKTAEPAGNERTAKPTKKKGAAKPAKKKISEPAKKKVGARPLTKEPAAKSAKKKKKKKLSAKPPAKKVSEKPTKKVSEKPTKKKPAARPPKNKR